MHPEPCIPVSIKRAFEVRTVRTGERGSFSRDRLETAHHRRKTRGGSPARAPRRRRGRLVGAGSSMPRPGALWASAIRCRHNAARAPRNARLSQRLRLLWRPDFWVTSLSHSSSHGTPEPHAPIGGMIRRVDVDRTSREESISNAHAGRDFEEAARLYFLQTGIALKQGFTVPVGFKIKKAHAF